MNLRSTVAEHTPAAAATPQGPVSKPGLAAITPRGEGGGGDRQTLVLLLVTVYSTAHAS